MPIQNTAAHSYANNRNEATDLNHSFITLISQQFN